MAIAAARRRFRRALSSAIDRREINQVIYYGLALEGNDTVLPESPLFRPEYAERWARFDLAEANRLLDEIGLDARHGWHPPHGRRPAAGTRRRDRGRGAEPDRHPAADDRQWREVGIRLFAKAEQRDVLRNRVFAGKTLMSVWYGLENALAKASTPPNELAPTSQQQLCWPKWGQYFERPGRAGEPLDDPAAAELLHLYEAWTGSTSAEGRHLAPHADDPHG